MTSPVRDAANGLVLQDAFLYRAPKGTTAPTDVVTALAAAWQDCGWIDQDGVKLTPQGSTSELKGVTGATLAFIKDGDGFEYAMNLIESNDRTASLLYPGGVATTATGITTNIVKAVTAPPTFAYCIEEHYSNGAIRRITVPLGVAVVGEVDSNYQGFRSFPVTISAVQASDKTLHVDITSNAAEAVS